LELVCPSGKCDPDDCVELTSREASVCGIICDASGPVSFTLLKATAGLHQEVVSRTVRRLAIHGLVRKVEGGYQGNCGCHGAPQAIPVELAASP
jgi:DNA-binding HxlR family transcriptional regulator